MRFSSFSKSYNKNTKLLRFKIKRAFIPISFHSPFQSIPLLKNTLIHYQKVFRRRLGDNWEITARKYGIDTVWVRYGCSIAIGKMSVF
ncbi:hypothetical protein GGR22_002331 [Flavobacterium gossypii]|uniref:Uncharacterized protein n=1 Tax=Flavobacterium gossypii TaxID=1646119 RepID=A0ABR6DRU0_9FLAO|nr:hypothetical protein [Flavobacterium gossypii]